ncbi:MAG: alkaline phosphatase family protein, partial [Actinomycetota bacterium]|nr:alkaline phosphatase family protein [Actinomycetota bacterium]
MSTARIVLGPLLRFVDTHRATVWVETDTSCEVAVQCGDVRGVERTWCVHGHHYALVVLEGLPAGSETPY